MENFKNEEEKKAINKNLFDHFQKYFTNLNEKINLKKSEKIKDGLEERANKNIIYRLCYNLTKGKIFRYFIWICIILNAVILATDKFGLSQQHEDLITISNYVFYGIFVAEMFLKLIGRGVIFYILEKENQIDFLIVLLTTIEVVVFLLENRDGDKGDYKDLYYLRSLKAFRLIRFFRLTRDWKTMNKLVIALMDAIY